MVRKKNISSFALNEEKNVIHGSVENTVPEYMKQYAASVILDRAIVKIDGLKPVQRRLLYTMYNMKLVDGKHTKLNNIGGATMTLHPHGDPSPSVYPMGAEWETNSPYTKIDGNGGNIEVGIKGASATRYTSGSLTKNAEYLMTTLKKNTVNMVPSYDESTVEPELLPTDYPNLFMSSTEGIAVGMSAKIIPHNPREIMDAAIYYMTHKNTTNEDLSKIILGPDFPTGGLLVDSKKANLRELKYGRTGKIDNDDKEGTNYVIRGEAKIIDDEKQPMIEFTSVPYGVTVEQIIESFSKFAENNQSIPLVDLYDETSDYDKVMIKLLFKKGTSKHILEQTLALLYQKTKIQNTISPNNLIISSGHPMVVSMTDYFSEWFKFRYDFTRKGFEFDLDKKNKRLEIVTGLLKLVEISDEVIKDARESKKKDDFKKILQKKHHFSEAQSEAIATMQLYRLGKQDVAALDKEKKLLDKEIAKLEKLLNDEKTFKNEIKRQLIEIRDTVFKDSTRKTKLVNETKVDNIEIDHTSLIKKQDVVVIVKHDGEVQRMSQSVYDNNIDKYDAKDKIVATLQSNTQQGMLAFTNHGRAFYRIVDELENQNLRYDVDNGQKMFRAYKSDDTTIGADTFNLDDVDNRYVVSITKLGMLKITKESDVMPNTNKHAYFKRLTNYNGLKLKDDEVINVLVLNKDELKTAKLIIESKNGKKTKVDLSKVNVQGASGSGSRKLTVKDDDFVVKTELI